LYYLYNVNLIFNWLTSIVIKKHVFQEASHYSFNDDDESVVPPVLWGSDTSAVSKILVGA